MIAWVEENKTLERYVELSAIRQSQPILAPNNFFCVCVLLLQMRTNLNANAVNSQRGNHNSIDVLQDGFLFSILQKQIDKTNAGSLLRFFSHIHR